MVDIIRNTERRAAIGLALAGGAGLLAAKSSDAQVVYGGLGTLAAPVAVSAAGTTQAGATGLASQYSVVTTCAVGAGVRATLSYHKVRNETANALVFFPASGVNFQNMSANIPVMVPAGASLEMFLTSSSTAYVSINGMEPIGDSFLFTIGPWGAFIAPFNKGSNVNGVNYTETILVNPVTFPNGSVSQWNWTPNNSGVPFGFNMISYGNYDNTVPQTPIPSCKVNMINTLTVSFQTSTGGATSFYDNIIDLFLTPTPGTASLSFEIEVFLHTPSYALLYCNSVTQIGQTTISGVLWNVSIDNAGGASGHDILFYPVSVVDINSMTLDLAAMFNYLVTTGTLTGNEYFNGFAIGTEPTFQNGWYAFEQLAVTYIPELLVSAGNFNNAAWTATGVTIVNPGASNQALKETAVTSAHQVLQTVTLAGAVHTYRFQCQVTAPATSGLTRSWFGLALQANSNADGVTANFNVATGTISGTNFFGFGAISLISHQMLSLGSGVYLCSVVFTTGTSDTALQVVLGINSADGTFSYAGNTADGLAISNASLRLLY